MTFWIIADNVNLLGESIHITNKIIEAIFNASMEDAQKTKHMFISHHHTAGQNHYIRVVDKSFENVAKLRHL